MPCPHCDHLLSFTFTHLLSQLYREKGSFGFDIHNILILYFILPVIQRDDQKGTMTQATSSTAQSIISSEKTFVFPSLEQSFRKGTKLNQIFFWGKGARFVAFTVSFLELLLQ